MLLASLWLPWFTTSSDNPNSKLAARAARNSRWRRSANAWTVFTTLDWLLVAACAAPFILTWIVARGHELTWKPGEVTMIVGIVAFMLILCNGIILGRPGAERRHRASGSATSSGCSRRSACSSPAICARPSTRPHRKPPGVI